MAPIFSFAVEESEKESNNIMEANNIPVLPGDDEDGSYVTIIMQGDTDSASDCLAFANALTASGNGYNYFQRYGWNAEGQKTESMVSSSQFSSIGSYPVAYYSGHGSWKWSNEAGDQVPFLNAGSSSTEFNVATTLGLSGTDWEDTCIISSISPLRVLILSACKQLNDYSAQYYARLMKASGVRVVAGYHDTSTSDYDDEIAQEFVERCDMGRSILNSWDTVNSNYGQPWAVLVYTSNENQNYRLPGFPGATYVAPSSGADIYRYMEGVDTTVTLRYMPNIENEIAEVIESLPLFITVVEKSKTGTLQDYVRDAVWTASVEDNDSEIKKLIEETLQESVGKKIVVQYNVTQDIIDPELGVVPESSVVVERTYKYYDTYRGIKITDSYISASIDSQGINEFTVCKRMVMPEDTSAFTSRVDMLENHPVVTQENAIKVLLAEEKQLMQTELLAVSLAYVPDGSGNHVLCYEFMFPCGFRYVSVSNGKVICF